MIIKHFEFNKDKVDKFNYYLFHGKNEGLKKEIIEKFLQEFWMVKSINMKKIIL